MGYLIVILRYIIHMGVSKTEEYTAKQNTMAIAFKAMGHPARIAILEQLMKRENCICGDLVELLPLSQATVSQHLKELKNAGLIRGTVEGTSVCYCIDEKWISKLHSYFGLMSKKVLDQKSKCC